MVRDKYYTDKYGRKRVRSYAKPVRRGGGGRGAAYSGGGGRKTGGGSMGNATPQSAAYRKFLRAMRDTGAAADYAPDLGAIEVGETPTVDMYEQVFGDVPSDENIDNEGDVDFNNLPRLAAYSPDVVSDAPIMRIPQLLTAWKEALMPTPVENTPKAKQPLTPEALGTKPTPPPVKTTPTYEDTQLPKTLEASKGFGFKGEPLGPWQGPVNIGPKLPWMGGEDAFEAMRDARMQEYYNQPRMGGEMIDGLLTNQNPPMMKQIREQYPYGVEANVEPERVTGLPNKGLVSYAPGKQGPEALGVGTRRADQGATVGLDGKPLGGLPLPTGMLNPMERIERDIADYIKGSPPALRGNPGYAPYSGDLWNGLYSPERQAERNRENMRYYDTELPVDTLPTGPASTRIPLRTPIENVLGNISPLSRPPMMATLDKIEEGKRTEDELKRLNEQGRTMLTPYYSPFGQNQGSYDMRTLQDLFGGGGLDMWKW